MDDRVRYVIYDLTMREGVPPSSKRVAAALDLSDSEVLQSFRRLAKRHMIVLQESGEILMAGPFSAVPTAFRVSINGLSCFGNCVWDALGIPAMLQADAQISTSCADCGSAAEIRVANNQVYGSGFMHFALPARLWWNDIVFT